MVMDFLERFGALIMAGIGIIVIAAMPGHLSRQSNAKAYDEPELPEIIEESLGYDDWDLFKETEFTLIHRLDLNGRLVYDVQYHGADIRNDLIAVYDRLIALHEGEMLILVQSTHNPELITFMCEKGEVVKIK